MNTVTLHLAVNKLLTRRYSHIKYVFQSSKELYVACELKFELKLLNILKGHSFTFFGQSVVFNQLLMM